tara:strand:- start:3588 stop:3983 length:396 start_codon:yes stop_codon:yes gene_type:complete
MPIPNKVIYSDFDITLTPHPVHRDISRTTNENAVKRALRNLIFTDYHERPFSPSIGSGVNHLLFEPVDIITSELLRDKIIETVNNNEPRVKLLEVVVAPRPDDNKYYIRITFSILGQTNPVDLETILERIR